MLSSWNQILQVNFVKACFRHNMLQNSGTLIILAGCKWDLGYKNHELKSNLHSDIWFVLNVNIGGYHYIPAGLRDMFLNELDWNVCNEMKF